MTKTKIGDTGLEFEQLAEGGEFTAGETKVQVDSRGGLIGAQAFGNVIERTADGMKITRPDGSTMIMREDGGLSIQNITPKSVGIKDLADVESYTVRTDDQGSTHKINFVTGGHVEVNYAPDGKFTSLSGSNVQQSINVDNEILLGQGDKPSSAVN